MTDRAPETPLPPAFANRLLATLHTEDRRRLAAKMHPVKFSRGQILYEADAVPSDSCESMGIRHRYDEAARLSIRKCDVYQRRADRCGVRTGVAAHAPPARPHGGRVDSPAGRHAPGWIVLAR